jgi:hypothetical protein
MTTKIDILLSKLASPARRAIQSTGITTLEELSKIPLKDIAALHGIGQNALNKIREVLSDNDLKLT